MRTVVELDSRVDIIERGFAAMDQRFDDLTAILSKNANDIDMRFDRIETRLYEHDAQFDALNAKFDKLLNTVDGFIKRLDDFEVEQAARDHKFNRLERWVQQLARNANVELS